MTHDFDCIINRRMSDSVKYGGGSCPENIIPMWIADTDFAAPKEIGEALAKRALHPCFGYPFSDPRFAQAVAEWEMTRFGYHIDEEWVLYASGVLPYITFILETFSQPGDGVLIQTPVYPPFHWLVTNNNRKLVKNPMLRDESGRYTMDFEDLERSFRDEQVKIMLLCNPQNPTMRCFTETELKKVGELCLKYGVLVVSDEIHCDICYPGHVHIPFASVSKEIGNITITLINPSKTFNTAGLRAGAAIVSNRSLREKLKETVVNHKGDSRNIFGSEALIAAYTKCGYYADELVIYLHENCRMVKEFLDREIPEIRMAEPEATYLLWLDCRGLGLEQKELCGFFEEKAGILLNDGLTFGEEGRGYMRMNAACSRAVLNEALKRMKSAVGELGLN